MDALKSIVTELRKIIFKTAHHSGTGHIAPSLSVVEILTVLYFGGIMKYDVRNPAWEDRDYFVMSKGHASLAVYAALAKAGYFPEAELKSFCHGGTHFGGILKRNIQYGIEASTGSLGQGLCFATGVALANKLDEKANHVFVVIGDGECQEGTTWEAAMNAAHHQLHNLTVIVDHNRLQGMDTVENIIQEMDLKEKWKSFGFAVQEVDGHDMEALLHALDRKPENGKPRAIIANTIKGKGISFMEGVPIWHYRSTNEEETVIAMRELGLTNEELSQG